MTAMSEQKVWERRPDETDKAWEAFKVYRDMPVYGKDDETRSLANLATRLGYKSDSTIEGWSTKYDWQFRVAAYENRQAAVAVTFREEALKAYQQSVVTSLTAQLTVMDKIITLRLADMLSAVQGGAPVEPKEIQQLMKAIHDKDDLARRAGNMPINFRSEQVEETTDEDTVFIVGG